MGSNSVNVDGYCWYGHNRRNIHIRAKNGSGGVGLIIDQVSKYIDKSQTVINLKYDTKSIPEDWLLGESVVTEINRMVKLPLAKCIYNVVKISKCGKAPGVDDIPVELYKNPTALNALIRVFNICYNSCKVPAMWSKCIITPVPKSSTSDPRDPMSYRGISLAPVAYQLYCVALNARLIGKLTDLEVINDEQNGFRKSRSTIDHL
ncbi:unnamed protein product [Mytilus coruscus]|uniref:Reverse transcriptase domain-containing protein n=1 Tax=Mytilus coruscus TaxID=42192 RepID=A0A6J8CEJ0_MYTCO|nr:unnamed protein product [Mytilus coruscus]